MNTIITRKQLWCAAGLLHTVKEKQRTMYTTADTTKGQSGSPVWIIDNQRHCLVGIAAGVGTNSNRVVRVTRELVRQLRVWITEGGESPAMVETREALEPPVLLLPQPEAEDYQPSAAEWSPEPGGEQTEGSEAEWSEAGGGASGPAVVAVEPFPTPTAFLLLDNGSLAINTTLGNAISALRTNPATKDMCVAVVDLRPIPGVPGVDGLYQGYNDDDMLYVGSLQKISPMYAAFELRARVRQHVAAAIAGGQTTSAADWQRMQADVGAAWQPTRRPSPSSGSTPTSPTGSVLHIALLRSTR